MWRSVTLDSSPLPTRRLGRSSRSCRPSPAPIRWVSTRAGTRSTRCSRRAAAQLSTRIGEAMPSAPGPAPRAGEWVLLTYRLPREPSTPRSAVWRKLRKLGVAQISDGLVALPAAARTREQLEWVAEEVSDAGGTAGIWLARPATRAQEGKLTETITAARAAEYRAL